MTELDLCVLLVLVVSALSAGVLGWWIARGDDKR
jgi:hypothetical protein